MTCCSRELLIYWLMPATVTHDRRFAGVVVPDGACGCGVSSGSQAENQGQSTSPHGFKFLTAVQTSSKFFLLFCPLEVKGPTTLLCLAFEGLAAPVALCPARALGLPPPRGQARGRPHARPECRGSLRSLLQPRRAPPAGVPAPWLASKATPTARPPAAAAAATPDVRGVARLAAGSVVARAPPGGGAL